MEHPDPTAFRIVAGGVVIACLGTLAALCAVAMDDRPVLVAIAALARDPWGLATLADLAAGLLLAAAWMTAVEARPRRLLLWLPLLCLLGNMATCIFLLVRLGKAGTLRAWLLDRN